METKTFGPYLDFKKIIIIAFLALICMLIFLVLAGMASYSANSMLAFYITLFIFLILLAIVLSFLFDQIKIFSLRDDGVNVTNPLSCSQLFIPYKDIISARNSVAGTYIMGGGASRDFRITIRHAKGSLDIYIPTRKQKEQAEFLKLLGEKIGKEKISYK